ncbi:MAG: HAD-IA family hydrolase [Actinobacteria bacterium]|nr:HAD-IA family hydrolase [Actinomycetota bacterium]
MTYRAVFFDAGETLVHPHPSFPELLSRVLSEEGHGVAPEAVVERLQPVAERFTRAARDGELWSTSRERSRAFWASVYRILLEQLELPWTDRLAERLYATFTDVANYRVFDDVPPVLEKLAADGLELGLISNFEEWLEMLLESLDLTRFFDVRVISGVEGVEKPDPAIFRLALERAGVTAAESAYVGDNLTFDVEPATAMGMTAVLIDRRDRHADADCIRITSMDQLPGVLGR